MISDQLDKDTKNTLDVLDSIIPNATYLSESTLSEVDDWIDTGSMVLNAIISGSLFGGVPKGRITQFCGPSQTFKTGFILQILANAQKKGMVPIIFDTEGAIDPESAKAVGLNLSKVKYLNPTTVEETRNAIFKILMSIREKGEKGKYIIAIDSIANLITAMEMNRMEKESESADMGSFAKAIKSLLKTCNILSNVTKTPILISNHVYDDPSAMFPSLEKNIAGGKAPIYLPSVTVQLARKLVKDDDGKTIDSSLAVGQKSYSGVIIRALVTKNRFIQQYLEGEMYLSFSTGLNRYFGLLEILKGMGVVENRGSIYYDWNGNKLGFYKAWKTDKELWDNTLLPELEKRIKTNWSYGNLKNEVIPDDEDVSLSSTNKEDSESLNNNSELTPLEKMRQVKKSISSKLDDMLAEEND
jgi:RecA/RadA recombinase